MIDTSGPKLKYTVKKGRVIIYNITHSTYIVGSRAYCVISYIAYLLHSSPLRWARSPLNIVQLLQALHNENAVANYDR